MKRRNFLQSSLTLLTAASVTNSVLAHNYVPPKNGFVVKALESRYKDKITLNGFTPIDFKLLGADTEDRLSVFVSSNNQKGFGPPLHVHYTFDEFFCVLDGQFLYQLGDQQFEMNRGDSLFVPRNVKHAFDYRGNTSGTLLVGIQPGKGMETYFAEMAKLLLGRDMPDMAAMQALFKSYNSAILGPPLK